MARARLNGVEIEYAASGSGAPVLLSHGYSATRRMWDGQHRAFPDYQVISWSMRGHGQTESPPDPARYSAALTVGDMEALLRLVKAPRAVVGGLSLGGYVSLAFYLAHAEMVRALVICDSGPGYRNAEARADWNTPPTNVRPSWSPAASRPSAAAAERCARPWVSTAQRRGSRTPRGACSLRKARA